MVLVQSPGHICFLLCLLYQCEPSHINQRLYFSVLYPPLVFLPLFLMELKYHTLRLWKGTCSVILLLSPLAILQIILFYLLNGTTLNVSLSRSLIVYICHSIISTCLFFVYMFIKAGIQDVSNILMLKSLSLW